MQKSLIRQPGLEKTAFLPEALREDFPILSRQIYGQPLVYFDSAASAQKPRQVIAAMTQVMEGHYANVHRGVHLLSQETTNAFEAVRGKVATFIGAARPEEIVFTRSATEGLNLLASCLGQAWLQPGDEVILSQMEHHANIVPWQLLRERLGIVLKVAPIDRDGNFLLQDFEALLSEKTKLVAITHVSNALGTVVPLSEVIARAHAAGARVVVDGSQAAPHQPLDMQALGADFYVFTGHKLYGPTAIGVLYGKYELLNELPPYQGGGEMITSVTFTKSEFKSAPHRFEAGTPAIIEVIGLGAAIDYVSTIGLPAIKAHEESLLAYANESLQVIPGLRIYGQAQDKAAILSFTLDGVHPHDIATVLDHCGIAVRAGHHCAQPVMDYFGIPATVRASFGLYNRVSEIDKLVQALGKVRELFG